MKAESLSVQAGILASTSDAVWPIVVVAAIIVVVAAIGIVVALRMKHSNKKHHS